ncbi:MAG TPA: gliding motility-associated C-terminal domain-containing protein [Saprospiraceae bacterium]|nr:gliding motility-associated C-terminal domain-containing protein [Saprospiraceae bacterium]
MSQNLVPNPDFETFTLCPTNVNQGGPMECTNWFHPTDGSSDYFNACAGPNAGVPINAFGNQFAHSGVGYTGIGMWFVGFVSREYLCVQLTQPLLPGIAYEISFYVSLEDDWCGTDKIGAYFSAAPPPNTGMLPINVDPQFSSNLGIITDNTNWTLISGCIVAEGGEQYLTIGNFFSDADTPIDPCTGFPIASAYYVDDVSLYAMGIPGDLSIELGGPVSSCGSYTIDPNYSTSFHYHWEDGSIYPTLTVTESGIYAVTISDGCAFGIDSLEVNIIPGETVEIGPSSHLMCEGDTYLISLDPTLGTYTWQNGSHVTSYPITTSGTYQVTLDDGCFPTTDFVVVNTVAAPPPNFLGSDTILCPGQTIHYSFDPAFTTFHWQNGFGVSSYTIMHEGLYALTITNICGVFTDSIDVTYPQPFQVDLGPDFYLCQGEEHDIVLDPDLGDFLWQDGSTDNFYTISTPGFYSVIVDNGCFIESSTINVFPTVAPVIDLGNDTTVCDPQFPILLNLGIIPQAQYMWQDGSAFNQFLVTGEGTYNVTVSNACFTVVDEIVVTVDNTVPNVILPVDQFLCEGESFVITNSGDVGNYLWQDNSTEDSLFVDSPGTYTLTVSTICGSGSDAVVINYKPPVPVPNLGPDLFLCPGEQINLAPNIPGVQYLWQDMSTSNHFVVNTPGTYYVQISDQCTFSSDTIEVFVNNQPPQLSLDSTLSLCQGLSLTIEAGIGGVSYLWNDQSQADSLNVTTAGTYSLTISNACGTDADTVIVLDGGPSPSINLGSDVSLCAGDTIHIMPVFSSVNNWLWNDGSALPAYVVTGNEIVSVQVSNTCGFAVDTLIATLLPETPSLDLGADTALCPGNSFILNITTPNVNIQWFDGSVNPQYVANTPGSYFATISNLCGVNSDTIEVGNLPAAPDLHLGIDQMLCPGEVITLDPGIQNVTYLWQDGSSAVTYSATDADTVILTVMNACGADTDTLEITISTDGPDVNLGSDILACEGDIVTLISDIGGVSYLWQDGSSNASFSTAASGTYILQVSNNCGVDKDTVDVVISGTIPQTDLGPDTILCNGSSLLLSSTSDPGTILVWQDGSSLPTFLVESPGTYILSESNHCGVHIDSIEIMFSADAPIVNLGPDILACEGDVVTLTAGVSGVNYLWQDGSTTADYSTSVSGSFILEVSNTCGADKDTIDVDIHGTPPSTELGADTTLCTGSSLILISNFDVETTIEWQDGTSAPTLLVNSAGTYSLLESNHCGDHADTITIDFLDAPSAFDLGSDTILCPGEFIILNAPITSSTIRWQDGSNIPSFIADKSQTYSLEISNDCGLVNDELILSYDDRIPEITLPPVTFICPDDQVELNVTQPFPANYIWSTGSTLPVIVIDHPGNYSVSIQTLCGGAEGETEAMISDSCHAVNSFYIPNIFSPNGDDINDIFTIKLHDEIELHSMEVSIYDRWGNLVFHSETIPIEWHGDFNGEKLSPGVYVYRIQMTYFDKVVERDVMVQGDVTLIR